MGGVTWLFSERPTLSAMFASRTCHVSSRLSSSLTLPHTLLSLAMVHKPSYPTASQHTKVQMTPDTGMVESLPILQNQQDWGHHCLECWWCRPVCLLIVCVCVSVCTWACGHSTTNSLSFYFTQTVFKIFLLRYNLYIVKCMVLKYIIWWVLTSAYTHTAHIPMKIQNISITPEKSFIHILSVNAPHCLPREPMLLFLSSKISFASSRTSFKWNHTLCIILCPASFTQNNFCWDASMLLVCRSFIL